MSPWTGKAWVSLSERYAVVPDETVSFCSNKFNIKVGYFVMDER